MYRGAEAGLTASWLVLSPIAGDHVGDIIYISFSEVEDPENRWELIDGAAD